MFRPKFRFTYDDPLGRDLQKTVGRVFFLVRFCMFVDPDCMIERIPYQE